MKRIDYIEDCKALQAGFLRAGIEATLAEVQEFWVWRSDLWAAGWLAVPESEADVDAAIKAFADDYFAERGQP